MEAALGGALSTHLSRNGSFSIHTVQIYCAELMSALGHIHDRGCIHRDIKASNCVLDSRGHIKICDFSAAKNFNDLTEIAPSSVLPQYTRTLIGTPDFMSPEMVLRMDYSYGVDVWAAGVLIYELLTCRRPFRVLPPRHEVLGCIPKDQVTVSSQELEIFFRENCKVDYESDDLFLFSSLGQAAVEFLSEIFVIPETCRISSRDRDKVMLISLIYINADFCFCLKYFASSPVYFD